MNSGNILGAKGEREACEYLKKRGYKIVETNLRIGGAEIDIVAIEGDFLVFIEVKSRSSISSGLPEEYVNSKKIRKIISGAKLFSVRKKFRDMFVRFDIISIVFDGREFIIDHIENAFEE